VKGKKEDKILKKLFRSRLEDAGIEPSRGSGEELFRRLAVKEFLRFNPYRFNIWYSGLIAAVSTAVTVIYMAGNYMGKTELALPGTNDTVISVSNIQEKEIMVENIIVESQSRDEGGPLEAINVNGTGKADSSEITADPGDKLSPVPVIAEIDNSVKGKNVIPEHDPESLRLRSAAEFCEPLKPSAVSGCCPLKVVFQPGAGSFEQCRWNFGDGGMSDELNPEWIYDMEGVYKVTLSTYKSGILYSVSTCRITVFPKPVARFEIIEEANGFPDNTIRLANYSVNGSIYIWEFGDGARSDLYEPVHTYTETANYSIRLVAISEEGCTDTMVLVNPFRKPSNYIEFPNAFLPNLNGPAGGYYSATSDEAASVFHPVSSGVSEYQLRIFSKTGILIFESNDINLGWDGYYKAQLCQSGVYIWKVRGNYINGEPFTKMGDVTLLRY